MKITIEAETPEEKAQLAEPWVKTGATRFGLAGRGDPITDPKWEFGFIHGPWLQVKAELARLTIELDDVAAAHSTIAAILKANNMLADHARNQNILNSVSNGHHRPRIVQ